MSDIKPVTRQLADTLKGEMSLPKGESIIQITPEAFQKTLEGTELTVESFKLHETHRANLIAAAGLAAGEIGLEAMKKDKKLEQVTFEMPVLKDSISVALQRSKEFPNAQGGDPIQKFGVLTSKYVVDANGNKGEYKKVRQHLSNLAAEALK